MSECRRVLVFGSCGVGKTCMISHLTGQEAPSNSDAKGCTLSTHVFQKVKLNDSDDIQYEFVDTVGLNESSGGQVSAQAAMKQLLQLILEIDGFHLLIMVIKAGRIDIGTERNYKFFVEGLVKNSIPVILVVTHCELERGGLDGWPQRNTEKLSAQGMHFASVIGTSWGTSEDEDLEKFLSKCRAISKENLVSHITKKCLKTANAVVRKDLTDTVRQLWNFLAEELKLPIWMGAIGNVLIRVGFNQKEAFDIARQFEEIDENTRKGFKVASAAVAALLGMIAVRR